MQLSLSAIRWEKVSLSKHYFPPSGKNFQRKPYCHALYMCHHMMYYTQTFEQRTLWDQFKLKCFVLCRGYG